GDRVVVSSLAQRGDAVGDDRGGLHLDAEPVVDEVAHRRRVHRRDEEAPPGDLGQQAVAHQALARLAQRRAGDAHLLGDVDLGDRVPGAQIAEIDRIAQLELGLVDDRGPTDRLHHREPDGVLARGHMSSWAGARRACVTPSSVPAAPRRISTARRGRHSAVTSQHGHGGSRPCNESALGWGSRGRALYGSSESDIRRSYCPTTGSSVVPRSPVGQRSLSEREPMHNRRSVFRGASLALSAAALGGSLAACSRTSTGGEGGEDGGSDLLSQLQDAGKIVVGFAGEAPYSFEDGGELMGATVAMHREIFGSLGIDEVEGKLTDWNSLIPGLNSRQFDA